MQAREKRKNTLLVEMQKEKKSNTFIDRRIGENDSSLPEDKKMLSRFQKERSRRARFNIDDETEELTHLGKVSQGDWFFLFFIIYLYIF